MRLTKVIFYIIATLTLGSCRAFYHPAVLELDVPDGPPEYRTGWYQGCRSGLSTKKFANAFSYDVTFGSGVYQHDPVYQSAWTSGFLACNTTAGQFTGRHPLQYAPFD